MKRRDRGEPMGGLKKHEAAAWPSYERLFDQVSGWRGAKAYVIEMTDRSGKLLGNNGDFLMHAVFDRMLTELGITRVAPDSAELIIVPPNGALLETYQFPSILRERIADYPNLPLIIFPSSALFDSINPAFIFEGRAAATLWFFRERYSFEQVGSAWGGALKALGVRLLLDHDVVASGNRFVREIIESRSPRNDTSGKRLLIGGRTDSESRTAKHSSARRVGDAHLLKRLARSAFFALPHGTRSAIARRVFRRKLERAGSLLMERLKAAGHKLPEGSFARTSVVDVSALEYSTFTYYLRTISSADVVVSDRLHIALPAAVLGKRVYLMEAGYHKLTGVYEQSLAGLPNVTLVR
ncbi:hypothetical protein SAMN04488590_1689 [Microbacterium sp. 77mftsu3.1]|nr:hypothetical protein SAMN04488590_1689 [Microbacterium sp. 77mftsu3.1]